MSRTTELACKTNGNKRRKVRASYAQILGLTVVVSVFAMSVAAQTQAVTNNNDGTPGMVPVYTGASTVGNSHISVADGIVRVEGYSSGFWSVGQPLWQAWKMLDSTNNNSELFRIGATNLVPNWIVGSGNGWPINLTGGNVGVGYPNMPPGMSGSNTFNVNGTSYFSGNVGIGMTAPQYPLDVAGQIHSSGGIVFPDGSIQTSALASSGSGAITQLNGNVGIGTTNPQTSLQVVGQVLASGFVMNTQTFIDAPNTVNHYGLSWADFSGGQYGPSAMLSGYGGVNLYSGGQRRLTVTTNGNVGIGTTNPQNTFQIHVGTNNNFGVRDRSGVVDINSYNDAASVFVPMQIDGSSIALNATTGGNVGIGTTNPMAKLDVNGSINISGAGAGIIFPSDPTHTPQTMPWTGTACGGDYAESVDVSGDRTRYEPGDVIVIDPSAPGKFLKSMEPYSALVSGIYSTKPGLVGRRQAGDPKNSTTEIAMAMVGIVPTKVSAENGPIKTGDLLVASATMGRAMKGTDRSLLTGAVIGKALGNLDSGTGVIEVLVTLQ